MASLYKKPIVRTDPKTGEKVKAKSRKWWGRYRDATDRERRVPLAADKMPAQAMLNELVRKAERQAAGIHDPFDDHRQRLLEEHLAEFYRFLEFGRWWCTSESCPDFGTPFYDHINDGSVYPPERS